MTATLLSTTRNEIVERRERGHCTIADVHGTVLWSVGDPDHVTYLRSSAKPMQATALVLTGAIDRFGLRQENLAVACGSHRGEPRHAETARQTLRLAGVPEDALGCGIHELNVDVALALAAEGRTPTQLHNNCSGKHAGMLAATAAMGAPLDSYLDRGQPVQRMIQAALAECSGIDEQSLLVGIDGCSAPNFAMPMRNIAQCFAAIGDPSTLSPELAAALTQTGTAMQQDPWLVAGTGRFDTALMTALPGKVIAKGGAEGLGCVAVPSLGLGIAVKFESGRADGIGSILLAILQALSVIGPELPEPLQPFDRPPILNHRKIRVGETRHEIEEPLTELAAMRL